MTDPRPFWLVWVANKNRGLEVNQATFATALHDQVPFKRHYSEANAKEEANRLANKTGARAYVLQAVGYVEPLPPDPRPVEWRPL